MKCGDNYCEPRVHPDQHDEHIVTYYKHIYSEALDSVDEDAQIAYALNKLKELTGY